MSGVGWKSKRNQNMERRGAMYAPSYAATSKPSSGKKKGWSDEARKNAAESRKKK